MIHECRWCEGHGNIPVAECVREPDGIREFNVTCADCSGEGEVDQEAHIEQYELAETAGREWAEEKSLRLHYDDIEDWKCNG